MYDYLTEDEPVDVVVLVAKSERIYVATIPDYPGIKAVSPASPRAAIQVVSGMLGQHIDAMRKSGRPITAPRTLHQLEGDSGYRTARAAGATIDFLNFQI